MKSIKGWSDWYVHPFTLVYLFVSIVNNDFYRYFSALVIVCIHEYGHYYFAKKFKFEIDKVEIFPFGAFLSLNDFGMHHICQELILLLGGLSVHLPLHIIIEVFIDSSYLLEVNKLVFVFNLLPIYPLDGSKIILLLLSLFKDYYQAIKLQIKISLLSLSILIVLYNQMGYILVYFYLLYINYQYIKEFRYIIIRLYLKRMHDNQYHRLKINHDYRFYRPYENYYLIGGNGYSEKEVLQYLIKNLKSN
ncbi:MAG: site-2 protease family protein [Thomasclavelia ramosa]